MWILFAFGSALFAGLTSILAKCGIRKTDSDTATAIRTIVVLLFSWLMVAIVGSAPTITGLSAKTWVFLILSGLATGASWLCYFRALQLGDVNKVVPIDKSSTILTIVLAFLFLGEGITWLKGAAVVLIAIGTFLMIEKKAVTENKAERKSWLVYAILSAVFASLTSILGKVGIEGHPHGRRARDGVAHCVRQGQAAHAEGGPEEGARLHLPVRPCNGRLVAVLLQGAAGRACQRGRAHR